MFSIFEIMFNQIEKQEMGFEFQNGDFGQFPTLCWAGVRI